MYIYKFDPRTERQLTITHPKACMYVTRPVVLSFSCL